MRHDWTGGRAGPQHKTYRDPDGGPQHAWVTTATGRHPALVFETRRAPYGGPWEAWVAYPQLVERGGRVEWLTLREWVPADQVELIGSVGGRS